MPETGFVGFAEFESRQKKLSSIKYFGQIKRNWFNDIQLLNYTTIQ